MPPSTSTSCHRPIRPAPEWQAAAEVLIGEDGGSPTMTAQVRMMRALHRDQPKAATLPLGNRAKADRIVK
jgi:hypothetical protein